MNECRLHRVQSASLQPGPAVELLGSGTLPLASLIEPRDIPLSEVIDAIERLARGEIPSKVMVRPGMGS